MPNDKDVARQRSFERDLVCGRLPIARDDATGCWNWTGRTEKGYGIYQSRGAYRLMWTARLFWPHGLCLDHLCRNRLCCNPEHLLLVTRRQNVRENSLNFIALNLLKDRCSRGHAFTAVEATAVQ